MIVLEGLCWGLAIEGPVQSNLQFALHVSCSLNLLGGYRVIQGETWSLDYSSPKP